MLLRQIYVHGFTVDEKGNKMSKSIGNVIHPKDIVANHNIDAMRWWIALHTLDSSTIPIKEHLLTEATKEVQVCRSTLMFILAYLERCGFNELKPEEFDVDRYSILDKFILNAITKFHDKVIFVIRKIFNIRNDKNHFQAEHFAKNYQFSSYVLNINQYINNDFSATYIGSIKDRLYCGSTEEQTDVVRILHALFQVSCKVLWPITPFLVEECWSYYDKSKPFYETEVKILEKWRDDRFDDSVNLAKQILALFTINNKNLNMQRQNIKLTASNDKIDLLEVKIV